jgi:hypothetical protein
LGSRKIVWIREITGSGDDSSASMGVAKGATSLARGRVLLPLLAGSGYRSEVAAIPSVAGEEVPRSGQRRAWDASLSAADAS